MTYWRTSRATSGARQPPGSHMRDVHDYAPHNSVLLPPKPPFERNEITQTLFDVAAVLFAFLFVSLTALAVVGSVGLLFFAL
jgi:hypothetical protein